MEAFPKSLNQDNPLYNSLKTTKHETVIDATSQATKYIKLEKDQRQQRKEKSKINQEEKSGDGGSKTTHNFEAEASNEIHPDPNIEALTQIVTHSSYTL